LALLAGLLPLIGYAIVHRVRLTHLWYYPGPLAAALLLASLLASALWERGHRGLAAAGAAAGILLAALAWGVRLSAHPSVEHYRVADAIGRRLARELPADARVAGWDVGLVAYRRSCRVTNLDGLVNSYDYLDALRSRQITAWLDREGVSGIVEYFDGDPLVWLADRDPALPARLVERFRMEFDYAGPLSTSAQRRAFVYFDYRRSPRPRYN
jgi:hypothetical protein